MGYQKVTKKAEHALEYRDHKNKRTPNRKKRNITENYNFVSIYFLLTFLQHFYTEPRIIYMHSGVGECFVSTLKR